MFRKTLAQRADDSVRWTRIPALIDTLSEGTDRNRRHLRWLPLLAFAFAAVGSVLMLMGAPPHGAGRSLYLLGFLMAIYLPLFGPVKAWSSAHADEYDRSLRRSAYLFAANAAAMMALVAVTAIGVALRANAEADRLGDALFLTTGWIVISYGALPTLWASWATRPPETD